MNGKLSVFRALQSSNGKSLTLNYPVLHSEKQTKVPVMYGLE